MAKQYDLQIDATRAFLLFTADCDHVEQMQKMNPHLIFKCSKADVATV